MRCLSAVLLAVTFSVISWPAMAKAGIPPHWPWHGVVMSSCCGNIGPQDIGTIKALGANAVTLNLTPRFRAKMKKESVGVAWTKSLEWADRMLDACKADGVTAIVRLDQVPLDPNAGFTERSAKFWDEGYWKQAVTLAGKLAAHFKNRGAELGAYAILDEPVSRGFFGRAERPPHWHAIEQKIVGAIRRQDPGRYVVVTAGPGGLPGGYASFAPLPDPRLIYNAHIYLPHAYALQGVNGSSDGYRFPGWIKGHYWDKAALARALGPLVTFQKTYGVPVDIGEFSAVWYAPGSAQYLKDLVDLFNSNGWGWMYFSYKGNPLWDMRAISEKRRHRPKADIPAGATAGRERWDVVSGLLKATSALNSGGAGK